MKCLYHTLAHKNIIETFFLHNVIETFFPNHKIFWTLIMFALIHSLTKSKKLLKSCFSNASCSCLPLVTLVIIHGQTLAKRTNPGPSLQVEKWLCFCYLLMFLLSKTAQLKVENLAQTTFRFSPVIYRAPRIIHSFHVCTFLLSSGKIWKHQLQVNRAMHIRHQCRKTTILSCHRCLFNTGA